MMGPAGVRSGQTQSLSIYQLFPQNKNALKLSGVGEYSTRSSAIIHNWEITAPDIMTPGCILSLLELEAIKRDLKPVSMTLKGRGNR